MTETAFSNQSVTVASLPDLQALEPEPVSPVYRKMNLITTAITAALLILVISGARFQSWVGLNERIYTAYPIIVGVIGLVGGAIFTYHWFADRKIRYALREQDLTLHKGLFFHRIVCQPVLRIQHIELKRGPVERLAGLARLQVFSAGGSAHTFEIPGLPITIAQKIRQFILAHKDVGAR